MNEEDKPQRVTVELEYVKRDPMKVRAEAVHDLICNMLRGPHIRKMSAEDLAAYVYKAGVALHNLPFMIIDPNVSYRPMDHCLLQEINALDPDALPGQWGQWAQELAGGFGITLD